MKNKSNKCLIVSLTILAIIINSNFCLAQPVITSFNPISAKPGDNVTLTGSGFNTTTSQNIVFFGATKATVTAASSTSITVTVPNGATYAPITVLNTASALLTNSFTNFIPIYSPAKSGITQRDFLPNQNITTTSTPYDASMGDIDGDGKPDMIVANYASNSISIFRNISSVGILNIGSFATKVDFTTGISPRSLALGDIDGDGKLDIIVVNELSNSISIFRNTASSGIINSSSLASKVDFTTATSPRAVAIGDIDGDGKLDIAAACIGSNAISVFRNTATVGEITSGSFAAKADFTSGSSPNSIAISDLDGDGKIDVISGNENNTNTVSILRNTSTSGVINSGSFATLFNLSTNEYASSIVVGDVDSDGKPDIIVGSIYTWSFSIFRNISTTGSLSISSFSTRVNYFIERNSNLKLGDLDGDGKPDIVASFQNSSDITIRINTSTLGVINSSSFSNSQNFAFSGFSRHLLLGDLDSDNKTDIIAGTLSSFTMLRNADTSSNNNLTALSISTGSLSPTFQSSITSYSTSVGELVSTATINATKEHISATLRVRINGGFYLTLTSGMGSNSLSLNHGANTIEVEVTAQNGTTKVYTINVTRALSSNASLSNLTPSSGTLTPSFFANTFNYALNVPNSSTNIRITATKAETNATLAIRINGGSYTTLNSGVASNFLNLNVGSNTIDVRVTAQNGIAVNTYSIIVTRALPPATITSFSPTNEKPGALVTIVGTNFNTTAANNIVYFGAAKASVLSSTSNSIVVAVPYGATYAPITVIDNTSGTSLISSQNFIPTYSPQKTNISPTDFSTPYEFSANSSPKTTALSDLDGDGKTDLVVINEGSSSISIFRNISTTGSINATSFASSIDLYTGFMPNSLAIGDLDGDGKPEIAVTNSGSYTISIFKNNTTIGSIIYSNFSSPVNFNTPYSPFGIAIGDIDFNGKPDIAVCYYYDYYISVFKNTSTLGNINSSSFGNPIHFYTNYPSKFIFIADIDGDDKPEVITSNDDNFFISIYKNTATLGIINSSSLQYPTDIYTYYQNTYINFADLDGDGKLDLIIADAYNNTVTVLQNSSTIGNFNLNWVADFYTGSEPSSIANADMDGDGKLDIIISNKADNTVSVLKNITTGGSINFDTKVDFTTGLNPTSVVIGDLDNDGKPEIITTHYDYNSISILRNNDLPSTTWNGSSWSNGVPNSSINAIIASSTTPSGSFTCNGLTINTGYSLNTTGITATINSVIHNNGNGISGTGNLTIASNSEVYGNNINYTGTLNIANNTIFKLNNYGPNQTIHNLSLNSSGQLRINNPFNVTITGNSITGSGTINNQGTITLQGQSAQNFPGTSTTIENMNNLNINNSNGVILNKNISISGTLQLSNGIFAIGGQTLTLNGNVTGSGTLTGSNTSNLVINGTTGTLNFTQSTDANRSTLNGTNALNNLTIGNTGNLILGNKLNLFNTLNVGTGSILNSGDGNLVFRNTSTSTAKISSIAGTPSFLGTVIVENNINHQGRGWRLLGSPLSNAGTIGATTQTITTSWQSSLGFNANYGTNIYAPAGALGMDGTSPAHSLLRFNADTLTQGGWTKINSTGVNLFENDAQNGSSSTNPVYFIFIRGDKSVPTGVGQAFVPTTLAAKGRITFGNKTINLNGRTAGYAAIVNPFISPVNLATLSSTGLTGAFYCWNPSKNAPTGGWETLSSANGFTSLNMNPQMQIGQAALVKFNSGVSTGSITFEENDKVTTLRTTQTGLGNGLQDNLRTYLNLVNVDGSKVGLDELFVGFKSEYHSNFIETEDVEKMNNSGENISSKLGSKFVAIDARPYIQNGDTIFMNFTNNRVANYEFEFNPSNFDATVLDAKLVDKFLNIETPISISNKTTVPFSVSSNTGSNAADRFMIVFRATGSLPNRNFTVTGEKLSNNKVKINWEAQSETGVREYTLQRSQDGTNYTNINTQTAKNGNVTQVYNYTDNESKAGVNYYRVKTTQLNDIERYSQVITLNIKHSTSNIISVYPNPVKGNTIGLQLQNIENGIYSLRILSVNGQEVYKQQLQISNNNTNTTINPTIKLASGVYTLQVVGKTKNYNYKFIVE